MSSLSNRFVVKAQTSLHICTVWQEPSLLVYTNGSFRKRYLTVMSIVTGIYLSQNHAHFNLSTAVVTNILDPGQA